LLVGGRRSRIDRSGIELLNRPRPTRGCRVNRRRRRRRIFQLFHTIQASTQNVTQRHTQNMILSLRLDVNTVFVLLVVRHRKLVTIYRRFERIYLSHIHSTLKIVPSGCTETPVSINLTYSLHGAESFLSS
jgi:hypothetical protein